MNTRGMWKRSKGLAWALQLAVYGVTTLAFAKLFSVKTGFPFSGIGVQPAAVVGMFAVVFVVWTGFGMFTDTKFVDGGVTSVFLEGPPVAFTQWLTRRAILAAVSGIVSALPVAIFATLAGPIA